MAKKRKTRQFTMKIGEETYDEVIREVNNFRAIVGLKPIKSIASGPIEGNDNFATRTLGIHGLFVSPDGSLCFGDQKKTKELHRVDGLNSLCNLLIDVGMYDLPPRNKYDIILDFVRQSEEDKDNDDGHYDYDRTVFAEVLK